jgi:hypothetical protein
MSNVIDLATRRKAKNPPLELEDWELEEDDEPWHIRQATLILLRVCRPGGYPLNDLEKRFVVEMALRKKAPTAKQEAWLVAISERVDAVWCAWGANEARAGRDLR